MEKPVIFISHISDEAGLAVILKKHIAADFGDRVEVFVSSDKEHISAGQRWLDSINSALCSTCMELILCSKASIERPWINFEAGAVWVRNVPIVPVCHTGFRTRDLPMPLVVLEGIEAGQEQGLDNLYRAIASRLQIPPPAADFKEFIGEVRAFEEAYAEKLKGTAQARVTFEQGERVIGEWEGTATDLQVPKHIKLKKPFSFKLELSLRREEEQICGELVATVNELNETDKARVELIHVSGEYFSFHYRLLRDYTSHTGIIMQHLQGSGKEMSGFYLTKKIHEAQIGFGSMSFKRKS